MRLSLCLVLGCCFTQACTTVAPYERETLARRDMLMERSGDAAAGETHAMAYREGSVGAVGASGGGCGCN